MDLDNYSILPALKFISGDSEHICRLCLTNTLCPEGNLESESEVNAEMNIEDTIRLQRPYINETLTFDDVLQELGVTTEQYLPHVLCVSCANITINAYLFKKLCQYSNDKWNEALDRLSGSLDQSDAIQPDIQSIYLIMRKKDNVILTSSISYTKKNETTSLIEMKDVEKSTQNYEKVKKKSLSVICEECGERFSSNCYLLKHNKMVHSTMRHPCPQCPKVFATQLQLDEHAERIHYPKKLQCPKCSKMFSTERMLKYHVQLHHIAAICKLCFVQFPSKKLLRGHLDKHDINKCPGCNKSFMNKHTFKFHLKICGRQNERQPAFFCDICNKGYARKNGLRTHLKINHGFGNVLSCNWCAKKFDAMSKLKNHIVKHTRERNFHCEQCGGKFVTQAALVYHVRLHTGERPFPCDMCNESFLSASRRMEHKRRKHFGPTKECHVCHVKFVTGHQLRKHVQRHYNPQSKLYVREAVEHFHGEDLLSMVQQDSDVQQYPKIANFLSI